MIVDSQSHYLQKQPFYLLTWAIFHKNCGCDSGLLKLFAFVLFFELGYRDVLLVDIFSDERQIEEFHFFTDLVAHTELILLNKNRTAALDGDIDIISRLT